MPAGELLMPVDDARVLKEAEILVLRSIQDAIKRIDSNGEKMNDRLQEIGERMIRVEMQDTRADVAALTERVRSMEDRLAIQQGAVGIVGWAIANWYGIAMFAFTIYVLMRQGGLKFP